MSEAGGGGAVELEGLPGGLDEQTPEWHLTQFCDFTAKKAEVGEPSPHLAMVGHMMREDPLPVKVWKLGCYAATYSLPTAMVLWTEWPWPEALNRPQGLRDWLEEHWAGVVTRRERRCVRSVAKMHRCLTEYAEWADERFPALLDLDTQPRAEHYAQVWKSVTSVTYIGRYIAIRLIEGLRRFCGVPAELGDIRSIGGWSPRRAMVYFFPDEAAALLTNSPECNRRTEELAEVMLAEVRARVPETNHYVFAAMLCEYREAFEDRHQYPGWTIDQEPGLFAKSQDYWGRNGALDEELFLSTRRALFPHTALAEESGGQWESTRWDCTKTLRDHGYVWSDRLWDFPATRALNRWGDPVPWGEERYNHRQPLNIQPPSAPTSAPTPTEPAPPPAEPETPATTPPGPDRRRQPRAVKRRRRTVNELVPGQLYQRGQILTWKRHQKADLLADLRVGVLVNFWPKVDPDLGELDLDWYLFAPVPGGSNMITPHVWIAADAVALYVGATGRSALVLCEAGVTRSVFFSALVAARLRGVTPAEALADIEGLMGRKVKLKPEMREALSGGGPPAARVEPGALHLFGDQGDGS